MGFDQKDAAIALYRTWEDPDAAATLLLAGESEQDPWFSGVHRIEN